MKPTKLQQNRILEMINIVHEIEALSNVLDQPMTQETEDELYLLHQMLWEKLYTIFKKINIKK